MTWLWLIWLENLRNNLKPILSLKITEVDVKFEANKNFQRMKPF